LRFSNVKEIAEEICKPINLFVAWPLKSHRFDIARPNEDEDFGLINQATARMLAQLQFF
jgi:hypothetical protein